MRAHAVALMVAAAACGGGAAASRAAPDSAPASADTLRGTLAIAGSVPHQFVQLQPAGGGTPVILVGPHVGELRALSGAEVWVAGVRRGARFDVQRWERRGGA